MEEIYLTGTFSHLVYSFRMTENNLDENNIFSVLFVSHLSTICHIFWLRRCMLNGSNFIH